MKITEWSIFPDFHMVRVPSIGDGSCFFHSLLMSFYIPYIQSSDKVKVAKIFRKELSRRLGEKVNEESDLLVYDTLSHGKLREFSKEMPMYSLESMQAELDSSFAVSHLFNEFIGNELNKDIYLLDARRHDIYPTGDDYSLLHKNRDSVVLLYHPGHYELIGLLRKLGEGYDLRTYFKFDDPFIQLIRERYSKFSKG